MKQIVTIKQIVCYKSQDFINELTETVKVLQENNQEVEIQYAFDKGGIYSALIVGRKDEQTKHGSRKSL